MLPLTNGHQLRALGKGRLLRAATILTRISRNSAAQCSHWVATRRDCPPVRNEKRHYHLSLRPEPLRLPTGHQSLLPLIHTCNNLIIKHDPAQPHHTIVGTKTSDGAVVNQESVIPFVLSTGTSAKAVPKPLGYLRTMVVEALVADHEAHESTGKRSPWHLVYDQSGKGSTLPSMISFAPWVNQNGKRARTLQIERIVQVWKRESFFKDILRGWSNEPYPVYSHPPKGMTAHGDPVAFAIERAALPLFGFPNFGSLLIAYFQDPQTDKTMIWVPRRALTKRTWPGKLDVTVGGGIGLGDTSLTTIIREAAEEASLDPHDISPFIRPVGAIPFPNRSPANWLLPGLYYLFDLQLPPDNSVRPRTNIKDGEVDSFELMDIETVLRELLAGKFKSSSAMAMVSFLIRHGFIAEESDARFEDVCILLNRCVDLPVPWR